MFRKKSAILNEVLDYILHFEERDFLYDDPDGPTEGHVYFKAYVLKYGTMAAYKMLKEVKAKEEERCRQEMSITQ